MKNLKKRYGEKKGQQIYYSMENEGHPSTNVKAVKKSKKDHPEYYKTVIIPKKKTKRK